MIIKVHKLINRLEKLSEALDQRKDITLHNTVNQFYYMQKADELKILLAQLDETYSRADSILQVLDTHYHEIYCRWRKDVKLL